MPQFKGEPFKCGLLQGGSRVTPPVRFIVRQTNSWYFSWLSLRTERRFLLAKGLRALGLRVFGRIPSSAMFTVTMTTTILKDPIRRRLRAERPSKRLAWLLSRLTFGGWLWQSASNLGVTAYMAR